MTGVMLVGSIKEPEKITLRVINAVATRLELAWLLHRAAYTLVLVSLQIAFPGP